MHSSSSQETHIRVSTDIQSTNYTIKIQIQNKATVNWSDPPAVIQVTFTKTYSREKWLISHLPPTFVIIIHIKRPLRPCFWRPRVPVPRVPASHTWCPQVPRLASPSPKSPHTRPDLPVPLSPSHFYTQPVESSFKRLTYVIMLHPVIKDTRKTTSVD